MKLLTYNPYDYNSISLKRKRENKVQDLPSSTHAVLDPNANFIGKWLGVDTTKEWNLYYDKVWGIYQWAKEKSGSEDIDRLIGFLSEKINFAPSMSGKKVLDMHLIRKLDKIHEDSEALKKETKVTKKPEPKLEEEKVNPLQDARKTIDEIKTKEVNT